MARNAHRKAQRDLEKRDPDAGHFGERVDDSVVRRIEDLGDDSLELAPRTERTSDDAGTDLAEDFGREFLLSATTGDDIGEIESAASETLEREGLALHEVEIGDSFESTLEDLTEFAIPDERAN